jgi:hypothetical protein
MNIRRLILLICTIILLAGCNGCNNSKSREKPDVSGIKVDAHILRFDHDLSGFAKNNFQQQQSLMINKYGSFFGFYVNHFIIQQYQPGDSIPPEPELIQKYIADPYIRTIQDSINYHFADIRDVEQELTMSFKYLKYYFPEVTLPKVVGINSHFDAGAFTYDTSVAGIGLDLYFGPGNADYDSAGIFQYLQHKMRRGYIARNVIDVLYNSYFGEPAEDKTLIEAMIDRGKKMYFISYIFPDAPDSLITGFTGPQTVWCEKSEYEIWQFLNDKDLLYKKDYMDQKRYLDEGPGISGMPPQAPGNIGSWIGLQIVRKFMKETGHHISLHDLILKYDSKTILDKARYRPSKSVF